MLGQKLWGTSLGTFLTTPSCHQAADLDAGAHGLARGWKGARAGTMPLIFWLQGALRATRLGRSESSMEGSSLGDRPGPLGHQLLHPPRSTQWLSSNFSITAMAMVGSPQLRFTCMACESSVSLYDKRKLMASQGPTGYRALRPSVPGPGHPPRRQGNLFLISLCGLEETKT